MIGNVFRLLGYGILLLIGAGLVFGLGTILLWIVALVMMAPPNG